ncbi:MAG TPA: bifunctional DNA-formamidopyrimidine glycosylase/DNA-(apurinic or apyrimidinic site) lyase [Candidatus Acidoferrum sp.]|nr:bifunctional DNA-formamidopyrimidine glycosylase/DNA-(apurinic or apyrimidinic site) lyase [Candidatus Acidoferrum sp.]
MPELPEVEVLVRHLAPLLKHKTIRGIRILRKKVLAPTSEREFVRTLQGAKFIGVSRRGKYLLFSLRPPAGHEPVLLVGHLGMTGRIYLTPENALLPKHAAVVLELGRDKLIYEDTRYFGRLTLDDSGPARLGPEPLGSEFTLEYLASTLKRTTQAIKIKLLDQNFVAGIGNIYASEALFRAGISPRSEARKLKDDQIQRLWQAIREVLANAVRWGSTLPLDFAGNNGRDGLFYYGADGRDASSGFHQERLLVYGRHGEPCHNCKAVIKRLVQGARSTFYCPRCQPSGNRRNPGAK